MLVHRHMGDLSAELAEHDDAPLPLADVQRESGITARRTWHGVLDVLLGERKQAPFLLRGDRPDTYRLADERRHGFLVEQGQDKGFKRAGGKARAETAKRKAGKFAKGKKWRGKGRK